MRRSPPTAAQRLLPRCRLYRPRARAHEYSTVCGFAAASCIITATSSSYGPSSTVSHAKLAISLADSSTFQARPLITAFSELLRPSPTPQQHWHACRPCPEKPMMLLINKQLSCAAVEFLAVCLPGYLTVAAIGALGLAQMPAAFSSSDLLPDLTKDGSCRRSHHILWKCMVVYWTSFDMHLNCRAN